MRKLTSEFIGTFLLALAIVGAGLMATRITQDGGLSHLINALTAAGVLGFIIIAFGSISGGHFNPAVTVTTLIAREISIVEGVQYIIAQIFGGISGVITANYFFEATLIASKTGSRPGAVAVISEIFSTAGLLFIIRHLINIDKATLIPVGVPLWIFTGYFFTPTSVVANPAMTIGRAFTDSYAGIAPAAVLGFIGAQLLGGVLGYTLAQSLKK